MGSSDNFCLRWNDFESNVSSSFRELRQNSEFFDVTLCCDNGIDTLQAHKVILAACSPLLRRILSHNSEKNPFIYLKGIQQKELESVLNFMYYGEVNIAQDSLNKFLAVAEELAVKGLTSNDTIDNRLAGNFVSFDNEGDDSASKRPKKTKRSLQSSHTLSTSKRKPDDRVEIDLKRIKTDPEDEEFFEGGDDFEGLTPIEDDFDDSTVGASQAGTSGSDGKEALCMEEARYTLTKNGNKMLVDNDGFCYLMNRKRDQRVYWVCQKREMCKVKAITNHGIVVKRGLPSEHTHLPCPPPEDRLICDL